METNKILSADVLDIIFDGRNKDYGAYELRKTYNRRIGVSLICTGVVCLLIFASYVLGGIGGPNKKQQMVVSDVQLEQWIKKLSKEEGSITDEKYDHKALTPQRHTIGKK